MDYVISLSLDKWLDKLRDRDFWLNGYLHTDAHVELRNNCMFPAGGVSRDVSWNVGVGPMASFTRTISNIIVEYYYIHLSKFDHVIKVDLMPTATAKEALGSGMMSIKYQLAIAAAKELGLLDQEYSWLKEHHDEQRYYAYGCHDGDTSYWLERHVWKKIVPRVIEQLSTKRYLLMVENLRWPIERGSFTWDAAGGFPPPGWARSQWFISTTSHDVCNKSKSEDDGAITVDEDGEIVVLTLSALDQSAKHIFNMIHQESKEYWHGVALLCFHYAMTVITNHSHAIASDELIHQWAAQGILPARMSTKEEEETGTCTCSSKCAYMHQVGRVILEAFQEYCLLQLPFSPAKEANEATGTVAQFFAYHGLIAQGITVDELSDNKTKWISFVGDHGWHVSREWFSHQTQDVANKEETSGPTTLILRGCSQQSLILSKLDHFLSKLCFLHVLDLSYTPLKSLPYSIGRLQNLRLLSLRGCHDLKTLFSSSTNSTTTTSSYSPLSTLCQLEILDMNGVPFSHLTQEVANQKSNLIYLDMSYSEVTTFPLNFFRDMSNLEELILVSCSNLVDLPCSMAALSSLTTLEVTGTQIKYFPQKIFEEMQKLQSLKLIDNKKLVSLPESISRAHGLIHLHIEGWESIMVEGIKLEGHPTLISFLLIGAPHIRRLSLRGCTKLESVELKNLGALEELDLSATAIKEVSVDIPNLPQLRRWLLMGVPFLRRFPWHKLQRLPDMFCLDQCAEGNHNHSESDGDVQVCVSDSRFFHSFSDNAKGRVRDGRFFQSFYVRVAPCIANSKRFQDEDGMINSQLKQFVQKQSTYLDVYTSYNAEEIAIAPPMTASFRRTDRHVEITGMQQILHGTLSGLLNVTKSISVTCDTSTSSFAGLSWSNKDGLSSFDELEECELRWCHEMKYVLYGPYRHVKHLRNVHVCNLKSLVCFCDLSRCHVFDALEHLHLEDCPRLENMLSDSSALPCLKTLDILFCYNLMTIFYSSTPKTPGASIYRLPNLQRIRLQELPLLQHIYYDNAITLTAPIWKEIHIRGCWSLQRLPCLQDEQQGEELLQSEKVKVNGERSWWGKLNWDSPLHRYCYEPKLPPEFASLNERTKKSSYLR